MKNITTIPYQWMCRFAVAAASLLCVMSVGCDNPKKESANSIEQTPAAKGEHHRIEAIFSNSTVSEEFADWNLFDGPRVIDPSSEYIYHDCDDPISSPSLHSYQGQVRENDSRIAAKYFIRGGSRINISRYAYQIPSKGLSCMLKADRPGCGISIGVADRDSNGNSSPILYSAFQSIGLDWEKKSFLYEKDFPGNAEHPIDGSRLGWVHFTITAKEDSNVSFDDIRWVNPSSGNETELRHLLHEGHVFQEGAPPAFSMLIFSPQKQSIDVELEVTRSDEKIHKKFTSKHALREGEQVLSVPVDCLPLGYYALEPRITPAEGAPRRAIAYFQIVPNREIEKWMGSHEGGAYLYDHVELREQYLAGYRMIRLLSPLDYLFASDHREKPNWIGADEMIQTRHAMGFDIIMALCTTDRANVDRNLFEQKVAEFRIKDPNYDFHEAVFPFKDPRLLEDAARISSARYKDKVRYWEYLNEVDRIIFHDASLHKFAWWGTPEEYARDLDFFSRGVKAGNPNALVLNGGVTCGLYSPGRETFVPRMLDAGAGKSIDLFAIHSYAGIENVNRVLNQLNERGISKPWINTERGIGGLSQNALRDLAKELLWHKKEGATNFVSFINRRLPYANKQKSIKEAGIYNFFYRFYDGSPTKKWCVFSNHAFLLDGAKDFQPIRDGLYEGYRFKNSQGNVICLWLSKPGAPADIDVRSDGSVQIFDLYGNQTTPTEQYFSVTVNEDPVYIVSNREISVAELSSAEQVKRTELLEADHNLFEEESWHATAVSSLDLDKAEQVVEGRAVWTQQHDTATYYGKTFGAENLSGKVAFRVSGSNLVLKIWVRDDEFVASPADAQVAPFGDAVILKFIDANQQINEITAYVQPDGEARLSGSSAWLNNLSSKSELTESGYQLTLTLPLSSLAGVNEGGVRIDATLSDVDSHSGSGKIPYLKMSMGGENAQSGNLPYLLLNLQKVK
ncbi:MAG: hypothetical protein ACK49J_12405 [Verrucomicrobiota bacterium]